jgi:DNA-3-methyladenine glycosylase II
VPRVSARIPEARPLDPLPSISLPIALNEELLDRGVRFLAGRDSDLAAVVEKWGPPPLWPRDPGFPTLVYLILEQQVSLASAKAAYERLLDRLHTAFLPERFLTLDARTLKRIGFSRQKAGYCRLLATCVLKNELDLEAIARLDDDAARAELTRIKGIGPWTADVYLLMALKRPDVWPVGDLALQKAARRVKRLRKHPSPARLEKIGEAWRPWRAVAARLLWHDYLSRIADARRSAQ